MSVTCKEPKLRFQEFGGEWEEKKLGELCFNISSGKTKALENGKFNVYGSTGIIGKTNIFTHDGNYILVARVGANAGLINYVDGQFAVTDNTLIIDLDKDKVVPQFLMPLLYKFNLNRLIFGSGQPLITGGQLKSLKLNLPQKPEQQKIASFLSAVDSRIEQLTKKEQLLREYKKGVMQKIFSQELRFKDDDGSEFPKWVEKKLGEIGTFKSGLGFTELEQGGKLGVPFFKVSDMNIKENKKIMLTANNYVNDEQISRLQYKPINEYAIIFAKVGAAIFLERKRIAHKFLIDNNMMAFIPHEDIYFIRQLFDTIRLSKYAQVGALPSYNASDLKTIKINLPPLKEQQKIANFLSSIDKKIEQTSKELHLTKEFKKGLLQQMFV